MGIPPLTWAALNLQDRRPQRQGWKPGPAITHGMGRAGPEDRGEDYNCLGGGMEGLSSDNRHRPCENAALIQVITGRLLGSRGEGLHGNHRLCPWEIGLAGLGVAFFVIPTSPWGDRGRARVERWGWGPTSPSDTLSLCISAASGMGSDTKINNLAWPSLRMMLIVTVTQPQALAQDRETFPSQGEGNKPATVLEISTHIISLLERRKQRTAEGT